MTRTPPDPLAPAMRAWFDQGLGLLDEEGAQALKALVAGYAVRRVQASIAAQYEDSMANATTMAVAQPEVLHPTTVRMERAVATAERESSTTRVTAFVAEHPGSSAVEIVSHFENATPPIARNTTFSAINRAVTSGRLSARGDYGRRRYFPTTKETQGVPAAAQPENHDDL